MKHEDFYADYTEIMYNERDAIKAFLYEVGGTWSFDQPIQLITSDGKSVSVTDIASDKNVFVKFFEGTGKYSECYNFAWGELSKVLDALPEVGDLLQERATRDIREMSGDCSTYLDVPYTAIINGKAMEIAIVDYIDGKVVCYNKAGATISEETNAPFHVGLRDYMHIQTLHRSEEYKELVRFLFTCSEKTFEPANFGDIEFLIQDFDGKQSVDVLSARLSEDNKIILCINKGVYGDNCIVELFETKIRTEYLASILKYVNEHRWANVIDPYNGHNKALVNKINATWKDKQYHYIFGDILYAMACKYMSEYEDKFGDIVHDSEDAMEHAYEIMEEVCDDCDLECILKFVRHE